MLNVASEKGLRSVPGAHTFSWSKRTEAILKKWEPIFKASVVHWPSYWCFDGRTAVLRLKGENEGTCLPSLYPASLIWQHRH